MHDLDKPLGTYLFHETERGEGVGDVVEPPCSRLEDHRPQSRLKFSRTA